MYIHMYFHVRFPLRYLLSWGYCPLTHEIFLLGDTAVIWLVPCYDTMPFSCWHFWVLLGSPRTAWELEFSRSRTNPSFFYVEITCQRPFFCSNIRIIKHFICHVDMFQCKVKGENLIFRDRLWCRRHGWHSFGSTTAAEALGFDPISLRSWAVHKEMPWVTTGSPSGHNLQCWNHL